MRLVSSLFASALLLAISVTAAPTARANAASVTTSGTTFAIDGKEGYVVGTNVYWLAYQSTDVVDEVMSHLVSAGVKVIRMWGYSEVTTVPTDGSVYFMSFPADQKTATVNTGANGLQHLDYVVSAAEKNGVKLVITLSNKLDAYGGVPAYDSWLGLSGDEAWYTNSDAQNAWNLYAKTLVQRHAASPAIFAWELMNEPRCEKCDTSVITKWATTAAANVKSWDPAHLVSLGDEGFAPDPTKTGSSNPYPFTTTDGIDFTDNLNIKDIDYGTIHLYPSDWSITDNLDAITTQYIQAHAEACKTANKPCMFEEYASPISDLKHVQTVTGWQTLMNKTQGIGGDMIWQFGEMDISAIAGNTDSFTLDYKSSDFKTLLSEHAAGAGM